MSGRTVESGEDAWRSAGDQTGNNCCSSNTLLWQALMNAADRRETNAVPSGQERRWRREGMTQLPYTHSPIPLLLWGHLANIGIGRGEWEVMMFTVTTQDLYPPISEELRGWKEGLGCWQDAQISGYIQDATLNSLNHKSLSDAFRDLWSQTCTSRFFFY